MAQVAKSAKGVELFGGPPSSGTPYFIEPARAPQRIS